MLASLLSANGPSSPEEQAPKLEWTGRQLKNQEKIDRLHQNAAVTKHTTELKTSYAFKIMRKDWNLLTSKMFWLVVSQPAEEGKLAQSLFDLHVEVDEVIEGSDFSLFWALDTSWLAPISVEFTIINGHAARLFRAIQKIDYMMSVVFSAEIKGLIDRQQRIRMIAGVVFAYVALKRKLIPKIDETSVCDSVV